MIKMNEATFKGKVRRILFGGKRVQVARSHSVYEINNEIPNLKIGDIVLCNDHWILQKL